jgi:Fe2+ or Zn2+ uptake regulation protein
MGMSKRITKATVQAVLKKLDTEGLTIELNSDRLDVWYDSCSEEMTKKAEAVCEAVCEATGAQNTSGNGSKLWVLYKSEPVSNGDYNDRSSRWHY